MEVCKTGAIDADGEYRTPAKKAATKGSAPLTKKAAVKKAAPTQTARPVTKQSPTKKAAVGKKTAVKKKALPAATKKSAAKRR